MSATVQCPRGAMARACHPFDPMAWPCRVQPACHVQRVKYIMGRICDAQSCEGHREKAQVKKDIVRQQDGVRRAEEFDEVEDDLFDGGLSTDHRVSDAVHLQDVRGNGHLRIDELLKGSQVAAVEAKAHSSYFDEAVHNREEAGGLSVEGEKGEVGQMRLRISHGPRRHCISALCVCTAPERALLSGKWLPAFISEGAELHSG
jgi:hypothetical protein